MRHQFRGLFILLALAAVSNPVSAADRYEGSPVASALVKADAAVEKIVAVPTSQKTLANTIVAIDDLVVQLRLDTEFLQFMAYVSPDTALRNQGQKAEVSVRNWMIAVMKREDLYAAVKEYAETSPQALRRGRPFAEADAAGLSQGRDDVARRETRGVERTAG